MFPAVFCREKIKTSVLLDSAISMAARAKRELHEEIRRITGIENPNSNPQMIAWLRMHKYPFSSLEKSWVARALNDGVPEEVKRVLALRSEAARTSDSKLLAIRKTLSADGRLRHLFIYLGASRAGRWTSHTVQFQNLPKPLFADKDGSRLKLARELVRSGDYDRSAVVVNGGAGPAILAVQSGTSKRRFGIRFTTRHRPIITTIQIAMRRHMARNLPAERPHPKKLSD
jgi:DNA polymerase